ncbi:MAG: response regulator [Leptospiraceae bacterium]|nr:response regulator [Leptospiraceae bacterium]MCP5499144.1 response regulator [Leptospiraceae bacterium]
MKKLYKVLLVEDDELASQAIIHYLEKYNFAVTYAANGSVALNIVKTKGNIFDIVLVDQIMPVLDGLSFLQKAKPILNDTPCLMMTAVRDKQVVLKSVSLIHTYLLKPIMPDAIFSRIKNILKLEEEDIIQKSEHPFKPAYRGKSANVFQVVLHGCPYKDFSEEVLDVCKLYLKNNSGLDIIEIYIEEELSYTKDAGDYLDNLINKLAKQTRVKYEDIYLKGPFLQDKDKKYFLQYKGLSLANFGEPEEKGDKNNMPDKSRYLMMD